MGLGGPTVGPLDWPSGLHEEQNLVDTGAVGPIPVTDISDNDTRVSYGGA